MKDDRSTLQGDKLSPWSMTAATHPAMCPFLSLPWLQVELKHAYRAYQAYQAMSPEERAEHDAELQKEDPVGGLWL